MWKAWCSTDFYGSTIFCDSYPLGNVHFTVYILKDISERVVSDQVCWFKISQTNLSNKERSNWHDTSHLAGFLIAAVTQDFSTSTNQCWLTFCAWLYENGGAISTPPHIASNHSLLSEQLVNIYINLKRWMVHTYQLVAITLNITAVT